MIWRDTQTLLCYESGRVRIAYVFQSVLGKSTSKKVRDAYPTYCYVKTAPILMKKERFLPVSQGDYEK